MACMHGHAFLQCLLCRCEYFSVSVKCLQHLLCSMNSVGREVNGQNIEIAQRRLSSFQVSWGQFMELKAYLTNERHSMPFT